MNSKFNDLNITNVTISVPFTNTISGWFDSVDNTKDAIIQDIKAFIFTNKNERVMRPNFGLGLKKYIFEPVDNQTNSQIYSDLQILLKKNFPFVELKKVELFNHINDNVLNVNEIRIVVYIEFKFGEDAEQITIEKTVRY